MCFVACVNWWLCLKCLDVLIESLSVKVSLVDSLPFGMSLLANISGFVKFKVSAAKFSSL